MHTIEEHSRVIAKDLKRIIMSFMVLATCCRTRLSVVSTLRFHHCYGRLSPNHPAPPVRKKSFSKSGAARSFAARSCAACTQQGLSSLEWIQKSTHCMTKSIWALQINITERKKGESAINKVLSLLAVCLLPACRLSAACLPPGDFANVMIFRNKNTDCGRLHASE